MGLFDKLTGTRRPGDGVAPRSAEDVRAALLGLNGTDVPYAVRNGVVEGADLVAQWRLMEPAWRTFFSRTQVGYDRQVRMRLVPARHEVRALDVQWEVTWVGDEPRRSSIRYSRGPSRTVSRRWTVGGDAAGSGEVTDTFRFDSAVLTNALRDAVLDAGWTWRAVVFGKL